MTEGNRGPQLFFRVCLPFLAGYFVSYIYRSINAIIGPDLAREFGLSAGALGFLSGVYFLAFALFQLPLGVLLDRYGPRRVNGSLLLVATAGGLWFALARSQAELALARALIGLGVSGGLMASFSAFALWYPPERLATMNGIAFASGVLGAITVTVPLEYALRILDWREIFCGVVALNATVCLVLFLAVPEKTTARRAPPLGQQLREFSGVTRDAAFWRVALCMGSSQLATVSLSTLWVAAWLRDVAGYSQAEVARALLVFSIAMIGGFIGFGRMADALARRGKSTLPLLAGGIAVGSLCLLLLATGTRTAVVLLWSLFFGSATSAVLSYPLYSRRFPKEMAGRVNTALNVVVFIGVFIGQWAVGLVLNLWPQTAASYSPEAHTWALGGLWLVQAGGLAWLWRGRRLFV